MTHGIDQAIFDVARALEVPVLILALVALAAVIIEVGAFGVELMDRRRRSFNALAACALAAGDALRAKDRDAAVAELEKAAWTPAMKEPLQAIGDHAGLAGADTRIAKALADFDFASQRRLGRTRLLVRVGPALGLMGTLIPLSPALEGLANGKVEELSQNLRVAFSVTVLGLLIGAVAFALSLYRDRIYGQDLSDLEYVAAVFTDPNPPAVVRPRGRVPAPKAERPAKPVKSPKPPKPPKPARHVKPPKAVKPSPTPEAATDEADRSAEATTSDAAETPIDEPASVAPAIDELAIDAAEAAIDEAPPSEPVTDKPLPTGPFAIPPTTASPSSPWNPPPPPATLEGPESGS